MDPACGRSARLEWVLTNRESCFVIIHVTGSRAARPATTLASVVQVTVWYARRTGGSHAPVAQRIEQRFPKPCVGGSSPPRGTILKGL